MDDMTVTKSAPFSTVTYTLPFARIQKLSRTGSRKSFKPIFILTWAWFALYFAVLAVIFAFQRDVDRIVANLSRGTGLSFDITFALLFAVLIALFLLGLVFIRRFARKEMQRRVNWDQQATLDPVPGGIHIATPSIEYVLKWQGIHEVLREPDGIVFVHGALFFLVPDAAFEDQDNRNRFMDYVKQNLPKSVTERSAKELARAR